MAITRAKWYQQCLRVKDGQTGSFLYEPETGIQHSPTFSDSVKFLQWCKRNGWKSPGTLDGYYTKDGGF